MTNRVINTTFNSDEQQLLMNMANKLANHFRIGENLTDEEYLEYILINICNDLSNIVLKYDTQRNITDDTE
jgi:hypothetical protein